MLARFLAARDRVRLEWPRAKDHRAHIHQAIDAHNLPVTHVTRRTGRPFTLVLVKTDALFDREAKERKLWQRDLEWPAQSTPALLTWCPFRTPVQKARSESLTSS
jgi:hypothetical protein